MTVLESSFQAALRRYPRIFVGLEKLIKDEVELGYDSEEEIRTHLHFPDVLPKSPIQLGQFIAQAYYGPKWEDPPVSPEQRELEREELRLWRVRRDHLRKLERRDQEGSADGETPSDPDYLVFGE